MQLIKIDAIYSVGDQPHEVWINPLQIAFINVQGAANVTKIHMAYSHETTGKAHEQTFMTQEPVADLLERIKNS